MASLHRHERLPQIPARDVQELRAAILDKLTYNVGKDVSSACPRDWFTATALAVRDRIIDRLHDLNRPTAAVPAKRVYYLSIEYLIGRLLCEALNNLDLVMPMREALAELGIDIDELHALEPDAALGNGGLGRLAACFMDSMASLGVPAFGYGIRYQYGLFNQVISDGWQQELPEDWLAFGNPWEFPRPELTFPVRFGGAVEYVGGTAETARAIWYPAETVLAVAYDTPVVGWRGRHVNALRLWSARAADPIQLEAFRQASYAGAMAAREQAEAISRNLYPSDATPKGQALRLRQEYFFTSASLQDIVRRHLLEHGSLDALPSHAAIQLNDTHPAIAVAELMRILIDEHDYSWEKAWRMTTATLSYTNHTLLPEALESWPVSLLNSLLPRHLQIILLINSLHLKALTEQGHTDTALVSSLSLISEGAEKRVRMGHLAFVGSHKVNGVSALHTELMRRTVFGGLENLYPGRIVNKTNGITFRRWLYQANPRLTSVLIDALGADVLDDADVLKRLEQFAGDAAFVRRFVEARKDNKVLLRTRIRDLTGIAVEPSALFDVQIKRIHEYKRQLLNILETIGLFQAIRDQPDADWTPRVKIFAGKAAGDYVRAKLIIKLAHDVGRVINADPAVGNRLKVVFLPNYSVSLAEAIIPASDLSEQISTAGLEASGTGNMKLALNGALTIGTLDGANVEIREQIGADNIFIFGLNAGEVEEKRRAQFVGREAVAASPRLARVVASLAAGTFSPDQPERFQVLVDALLGVDPFMVAADFEAYWHTQRAVDALWKAPQAWWRTSILSTARMGWFSSDRTIREYSREIWDIHI
ncbi:MAG: glycogen phosphorylase [Alphaproteobacteria bacterium]|jgi:starch phosphorylase|nr:glycogen phosphorylase [Alphaproteobacteria bacterium]